MAAINQLACAKQVRRTASFAASAWNRCSFHGDQLLGITGRAGIFKSLGHGAPWVRSMQGLVAQNGVSPYVISRCQAPSDPRIVYILAGLGGAVTPFNGLFLE